MLYDWLERLLTRCPVHLREMGYLREVLGIRSRYRRYRSAWESHCLRSRDLILRAAGRCRQRRKAVVLGSGWLHDVPVEQLAGRFAEVVLVDLFHPLATRGAVRKYRNVRLVAADVTGTLEQVWELAHTPGAALPRSAPTLFADDPDLDLTVSLNLLSQLPCMPESYLRRAKVHPGAAILAWCRELVRSHLAYLERLPGVVCLIADTEVRTVNQDGEELSREPTLYGERFPFEAEEWIWTLVPARGYPYHGEQLVVKGVADVKEAKRVE